MTKKISVNIDDLPHEITITLDSHAIHVSVVETGPAGGQGRMVGQGSLRIGEAGQGLGRRTMAALSFAFTKIVEGGA